MAFGGRVIRKILTLINEGWKKGPGVSAHFLLKLMAYDDYIPRVGPQGKRKTAILTTEIDDHIFWLPKKISYLDTLLVCIIITTGSMVSEVKANESNCVHN